MADKYPQTIPDFRTAITAFDAPEELAERFDEIKLIASPPVQILNTFAALKDAEDLDESALMLLAGSAHLVAIYAFEGRASEAVEVLVRVTAGLI